MTAQKHLNYVALSMVKKEQSKIDIRFFAIYLFLLYVGKLLISCGCLPLRGCVCWLLLSMGMGLRLSGPSAGWVLHLQPVFRPENKHSLWLETWKYMSMTRCVTTERVRSHGPLQLPTHSAGRFTAVRCRTCRVLMLDPRGLKQNVICTSRAFGPLSSCSFTKLSKTVLLSPNKTPLTSLLLQYVHLRN